MDGFRFDNIHVRRELQTFRRLDDSEDLLFTVRTFIEPMIGLNFIEIKGLVKDLETLSIKPGMK